MYYCIINLLSIMKSSNTNNFSILRSILTVNELNMIAQEMGLIIRAPRKIEVSNFIDLIFNETQKGSPSYNDIASRYQAVYQNNPSKQSINKKFSANTVELFKRLLEISISKKLENIKIEMLKFNRIIIQDSTIIRLPNTLYDVFKGVSNHATQACNARIQCVYDIVSERFISFSIDPYSKNDASVADEIDLIKGDLALRDRGYFKTTEFKKHNKIGSHCIYRYKYNTKFLDVKTKKPINLIELLRKNKFMDTRVCLNDEKHTEIRLIATPVSDDIANERRRKAKTDNRSNPCEERLELLSWSIFLTTIPIEMADEKQIYLLYCLRWRIEIMFKSWKSNMNFSKIHRVSEIQLRVYLYARFILTVLAIQKIYAFFAPIIFSKHSKHLSLLKTTKYLNSNLDKIVVFAKIIMNDNKIEIEKICDTLTKYCCYDKRTRLNFNQLYNSLFLS